LVVLPLPFQEFENCGACSTDSRRVAALSDLELMHLARPEIDRIQRVLIASRAGEDFQLGAS